MRDDPSKDDPAAPVPPPAEAGSPGRTGVEALIADFHARLAGLRADGVPTYPPLGGRTPWAEAPEAEKLANIVWESMAVHLGAESFDPGATGPTVISLPGVVALEAIERHVDPAGLPGAQRELLAELRTRVDAGAYAGPPPPHRDAVADALGRIEGVGDLDRMFGDLREPGGRPWGERTEAEKVRAIVDAASEAAAPGDYTLRLIEREVDYAALPPWRREALEGLRARLDRDPAARDPFDPDHRADVALRLAELEARVEDDRRLGARDGDGRRWPWAELADTTRLDLILVEMSDLHLESEPAAYDLAARAVDLDRVGDRARREFEAARAGAVAGADLTRRLDALDARIEGLQHVGTGGPEPGRGRGGPDRDAEARWGAIRGAIATLQLESVPAAYVAAARAVDLARLSAATRQEFDAAREAAEAHLAAIRDPRDELPSPAEWRQLRAEWAHDHGLRRLEDRGVSYEDEPSRPLDHTPAPAPAAGPAARARFQKRDPDRNPAR